VGEYPLLEEAYKEESAKPDGAVILALNIRQSSQALVQFNEENSYTVPILMDPGALTAINYKVSAIPATFFIDRQGTIRYVQRGAFSNLAGLKSQLSKITGP
jgi:cytochrome c biogenesis protein CcmG/thiol:disulfide interchange protein DsbE